MRSLERASIRQMNRWSAVHSCTKAASDSKNAYLFLSVTVDGGPRFTRNGA
jgi:hypothetical protein